MLRSTPDTTEEFWQKVEKNLGCEVCAYALAQYSISASASRRNAKNALWGLLYVSKRGIHFYRFAQQSWMGALMNRTSSEEFSFTIWFEDIQAWRVPQKLPFFKSLFVPDDSCLMVRGKSVQLPLLGSSTEIMHADKKKSDVVAHYFALDMRKQNIAEALELYVREKRVVTTNAV